MAYIVPQVKVFQEFETIAGATRQPLHAFIFGENFNLFRYSIDEEKAKIGIGSYDRAIGNSAAWPSKPANSPVDQSWARLFFDNAWLEYFRDYVGSGHEIKAVVGQPNRIYCSTLNFATYGAWARSAEFKDRDVMVGDGIVLRGTCGSEQFEFFTRVSRLVNDIVPSSVGTPYADSNNAPDSTEGAVMAQESGSTGTVTFTADPSLYDGSADGDTVDSYFLTVVTGGAFGDAQMSVTSASGRDNSADPLVPIDGTPVFVGSRGLRTTFSTLGSGDPFEVGQVFRIDVNQDWVTGECEEDPTASYIGSSNGTYIISVVEGGKWAAAPKVFVSSTGTLDSSGPYTVSEDGYVTLPSGARFRFPATATLLGLAKNDRFYIDVVATQAGPIHTIEVRNSLPAAAMGDCYGGPGAPVDLDLSLSIVKNIEIPRIKLGVLYNWTTSPTAITVEPGITAKDTAWYDSLGNLLDMPVVKADMLMQYRSYSLQHATALGLLNDVSQVEPLLGPAVADNPLSLGMFKALQNSNGMGVYYMATEGPSVSDFSKPLAAVYDLEGQYGLVALTHNKDVQDMVYGHCLQASSADRGRWRVMWTGCSVSEESAVLQRDSYGQMLFCTVVDDPDVPGTQYIRLRCNEAGFLSAGVVATNVVRGNYFTNPNTGAEEYTEWIIDEVLTEEEVRLASGPELPITVPSRFEVWKNNSHEDIADQVIALAGSYSNRRARVVFPDYLSNGGVAIDNMFACAALAGLRSGVWPHQGLTNVELAGFDDVSRTTSWLGGLLLDSMAAAGVWIVTQDITGTVYTRHQLTTDMTDINRREDSMVSNFDSISYRFMQFFRNSRYIGRRNITPDLLVRLQADFIGLVETIKYESDVPELGPQILNATLNSLQRHPTLLDHVVANISIDMPEPFNNFEITLVAQAN